MLAFKKITNMFTISLLFLHLSLSHANLAANFTVEMMWKQNLAGKVLSDPQLSDTKIFVGSNAKRIFCLDRESGDVQWNVTTEDEVKTPGVLCDEKNHFFFGDNGIMHALHTENGSTFWTFDAASPIIDAPVWGSNDVLIFASDAGEVHCLNSSTGAELWSYDTGFKVVHSPVAGNNRVFVGSQNNFISCLKMKNGKKKWDFNTGGEMETSPLLDSMGNVFIGSASGLLQSSVYALKQSTGEEIWSHNTSNSLRSNLIVNNDTLYFATVNGIIEALGTSDGAVVWSYDSGTKVSRVLI